MKKFVGIFIGLICGGVVLANEAIFQHPSSITKVQIPQYSQVACKFTQTKTIPNSKAYIKSGGNFKFDVTKGVVFETLYPKKSTTAYTTEQSKRISDIIIAINKKDYSYINQNFNVYYLKTSTNWELALKPKKSSKISSVMDSIIIEGNNYINNLDINTLKSGSTKINFTECR